MFEVFCALSLVDDYPNRYMMKLLMESLEEKYGYFDQCYVDEAMDREPVEEEESNSTERRLLIGIDRRIPGMPRTIVCCGPIC